MTVSGCIFAKSPGSFVFFCNISGLVWQFPDAFLQSLRVFSSFLQSFRVSFTMFPGSFYIFSIQVTPIEERLGAHTRKTRYALCRWLRYVFRIIAVTTVNCIIHVILRSYFVNTGYTRRPDLTQRATTLLGRRKANKNELKGTYIERKWQKEREILFSRPSPRRAEYVERRTSERSTYKRQSVILP